MAISKVDYFGKTLIDLTGDTVAADKLLKGTTAHDKAGNAIVGTAEAGNGGGGSPDYGVHTCLSVFTPTDSSATLVPYPTGSNSGNIRSLAILQQEQHGDLGDGWRAIIWSRSYSKSNDQTSHGIYSKDGFMFDTPKKQKPVSIMSTGISVNSNAPGAFFAPVPHLVVAIVNV